jgi:nucleoside-diphosphate-sugar epimerase
VRLLVTGHRGDIGVVVAARLAAAGHEVVGFDLADGDDLRDADAVRAAARGCEAAIHMAAIPDNSLGDPSAIMATNVLGTWHVLMAAREEGMSRVVAFSSLQALGVAEDRAPPAYLPLDDDHPRRARRPYGLSKRVGEDLCRAMTEEAGIATVCLRPVAVWDEERYARVEERRRARPEDEWEPRWELGAFVDVRDVASAVLAALACPDPGHARLLLCAGDIAASAPGREMAARLLPGVPWRGGPAYDADPWRALVDTSRAERVLGWRPEHRWADRPGARATRA